MSLNLSTRLVHAWNAFTSRDPTQYMVRDILHVRIGHGLAEEMKNR